MEMEHAEIRVRQIKEWDERLGTMLVDACIDVHDEHVASKGEELSKADANLRTLVSYMCNEAFGERQY